MINNFIVFTNFIVFSEDKKPDIKMNACIWKQNINTTIFLINELGNKEE